MELLEEILGVYTISLYREGKRLAEIKTLSFFLKMVKSIRQLALMYYLSVVSFIILAGGVFTVLFQALNQFQHDSRVYVDPIIIFGAGLILVSIFSTLWLLNEKRWLNALHLNKYLEKYSKNSLAQSPSQAMMSYDPNQILLNKEDLKNILDELIDKKLKEHSREINV